MTLAIKTATLVGSLLGATVCSAQPYSYQIDAKVLYDVVTNRVTYPNTEVWGMPFAGMSSGILDLVIDKDGKVSGSTRTAPGTQTGILKGQRLLGVVLMNRSTYDFQMTTGTWGTPVKNVAQLTTASVDLSRTFLGDFYGLGTVVSGFIKDGNSGDYFNLSNGLGLDGKIELTVAGKDGMSVSIKFKVFSGYGMGWYNLGVEGGSLTYKKGTNAGRVDFKGITASRGYFDPAKRTFSIAKYPIITDVVTYPVAGRRIDTFSGQVSSTGNFVGTAHLAGREFQSVTGSTTNGTFEDSNSTGFDLSNGLVLGDKISMSFTDPTGRMDLVVSGRLIRQPRPPWTDLGKGLKGTSGVPTLSGSGSLTGGSRVSLAVTNARASAGAFLGIGFTRIDFPFLGGTLIPDVNPPGIVLPASIDATGNFLLKSTWSGVTPPGFTVYFQCWIVDPVASYGLAATNGLMAGT